MSNRGFSDFTKQEHKPTYTAVWKDQPHTETNESFMVKYEKGLFSITQYTKSVDFMSNIKLTASELEGLIEILPQFIQAIKDDGEWPEDSE